MMKRYRLYFNRRGEKPWSLDEGTQETEWHYDEVRFRPTGMPLCIDSKFDPSVTDWENVPVAWLEFRGVVTEFVEDGKLIAQVR